MSTTLIAEKLAAGFGVTLFVAGLSLFIGFIAAIPFGIALNNQKCIAYLPLRFLNDFIRSTPLLIQLFFVYFGAPQIGITLTPLQAAIFTLSLNTAAYMSEVIRSGLIAVPQGQRRAGRALGLTKIQVMRYVVWPQAFRVALPALMNSVVALLKDTALISIISVSEVIREAQSIISVTYDPIRYYLIAGLMFFAFTFPLMKLAGFIEHRIKQKGFGHA